MAIVCLNLKPNLKKLVFLLSKVYYGYLFKAFDNTIPVKDAQLILFKY
jgi:hypothetical protein